jgi:hypothetical protein
VAFDVSISGAAPVTVIVSCSWPTSSWMSSVTNCCARDANALVLEGLEACQLRLDRVVPGGTAAKLYCPVSFETASRDAPVASLISVTVTPGTTPCDPDAPRNPPLNVLRTTGVHALVVASGTNSSARKHHLEQGSSYTSFLPNRREPVPTALRLERAQRAIGTNKILREGS